MSQMFENTANREQSLPIDQRDADIWHVKTQQTADALTCAYEHMTTGDVDVIRFTIQSVDFRQRVAVVENEHTLTDFGDFIDLDDVLQVRTANSMATVYDSRNGPQIVLTWYDRAGQTIVEQWYYVNPHASNSALSFPQCIGQITVRTGTRDVLDLMDWYVQTCMDEVEEDITAEESDD